LGADHKRPNVTIHLCSPRSGNRDMGLPPIRSGIEGASCPAQSRSRAPRYRSAQARTIERCVLALLL
jgi:hypothetical protein